MNSKYKILVIGDIMIDKYTYVQSNRTASEAPIPVWDVIRTELRLGGAANVANNIEAIGKEDVNVYLAGIVGSADGETNILRSRNINNDMCIGGKTMLKHRYIDDVTSKHIMRCDNILCFSKDDVDFFKMFIRGYVWNNKFDAVVISDYDKGTITEEIVNIVKPISWMIVDSKRKDLRMFSGAKVLKLNNYEYSLQASNKEYINFEKLFENVVVTKGSSGAELRQCEISNSNDNRYIVHTENFSVEKVKANDVTGCGDTHTAAMAYSLLCNNDIRVAIKFANACASTVVKKFGTSTI